MRLAVKVLPLQTGPASSLPSYGPVPVYAKSVQFAIAVNGHQTFAQIWNLIESRYTQNYMTPDLARNFAIRKLQDAYGSDLDVRDTVGAIFSDEPAEKRLLLVVPTFLGREDSIPVSSSLRPSAVHRSFHQAQANHAVPTPFSAPTPFSEHRRWLDNYEDADPIPSSEDPTANASPKPSTPRSRKSLSKLPHSRDAVMVEDSQRPSSSRSYQQQQQQERSLSEERALSSVDRVIADVDEHLQDASIPSPQQGTKRKGTMTSDGFLKPPLPPRLAHKREGSKKVRGNEDVITSTAASITASTTNFNSAENPTATYTSSSTSAAPGPSSPDQATSTPLTNGHIQHSIISPPPSPTTYDKVNVGTEHSVSAVHSVSASASKGAKLKNKMKGKNVVSTPNRSTDATSAKKSAGKSSAEKVRRMPSSKHPGDASSFIVVNDSDVEFLSASRRTGQLRAPDPDQSSQEQAKGTPTPAPRKAVAKLVAKLVAKPAVVDDPAALQEAGPSNTRSEAANTESATLLSVPLAVDSTETNTQAKVRRRRWSTEESHKLLELNEQGIDLTEIMHQHFPNRSLVAVKKRQNMLLNEALHPEKAAKGASATTKDSAHTREGGAQSSPVVLDDESSADVQRPKKRKQKDASNNDSQGEHTSKRQKSDVIDLEGSTVEESAPELLRHSQLQGADGTPPHSRKTRPTSSASNPKKTLSKKGKQAKAIETDSSSKVDDVSLSRPTEQEDSIEREYSGMRDYHGAPDKLQGMVNGSPSKVRTLVMKVPTPTLSQKTVPTSGKARAESRSSSPASEQTSPKPVIMFEKAGASSGTKRSLGSKGASQSKRPLLSKSLDEDHFPTTNANRLSPVRAIDFADRRPNYDIDRSSFEAEQQVQLEARQSPLTHRELIIQRTSATPPPIDEIEQSGSDADNNYSSKYHPDPQSPPAQRPSPLTYHAVQPELVLKRIPVEANEKVIATNMVAAAVSSSTPGPRKSSSFAVLKDVAANAAAKPLPRSPLQPTGQSLKKPASAAPMRSHIVKLTVGPNGLKRNAAGLASPSSSSSSESDVSDSHSESDSESDSDSGSEDDSKSGGKHGGSKAKRTDVQQQSSTLKPLSFPQSGTPTSSLNNSADSSEKKNRYKRLMKIARTMKD